PRKISARIGVLMKDPWRKASQAVTNDLLPRYIPPWPSAFELEPSGIVATTYHTFFVRQNLHRISVGREVRDLTSPDLAVLPLKPNNVCINTVQYFFGECRCHHKARSKDQRIGFCSHGRPLRVERARYHGGIQWASAKAPKTCGFDPRPREVERCPN